MTALRRHPWVLAILLAIALAGRALPVGAHVDHDGMLVFVPCGGGAVALDLATGETVDLATTQPAAPAAPPDCCEDCSMAKAAAVGTAAWQMPLPPAAETAEAAPARSAMVERRSRANRARAPPPRG